MQRGGVAYQGRTFHAPIGAALEVKVTSGGIPACPPRLKFTVALFTAFANVHSDKFTVNIVSIFQMTPDFPFRNCGLDLRHNFERFITYTYL